MNLSSTVPEPLSPTSQTLLMMHLTGYQRCKEANIPSSLCADELQLIHPAPHEERADATTSMSGKEKWVNCQSSAADTGRIQNVRGIRLAKSSS